MGAYSNDVWQPPQHVSPAANAYVSLRWRMIAASIAVALNLVFDFVLDLVQMMAGKSIEGDDPDLVAALAVVVSALAQIGSFVIAIVFVCIFIHRAVSNLSSLGRYSTFTPGWAVGWFFVPFANLARPPQMMGELWRGSDPNGSGTTMVGGWWACWIVGNIVAYVSSKVDDTTRSGAIGLFGSVFTAIAGVMLVLLMRGIARNQAQLSGRE